MPIAPKQVVHLQPDLTRIRWYDGAGRLVTH
jgi:hypothetical protein